MRKLKNKVICLVGESGSGKTTLYDMLRKEGYGVVDSYTTRLPRFEGEQGHTFVTQEEFDALRDDFAAYTTFAGAEYATTFEQLEGNEFYVIDPAGVEDLTRKVGRENLIVVYLDVHPSIRFVRMRQDRGEKEAHKRIQHDNMKFDDFHSNKAWDIVLTNEDASQLNANLYFLERLVRKAGISEV